mmetsp:Transcript_68534/g.161111  ORF Transcript_68534/g.161111 Transcript_68534/m.161111 type:complete len:124 (+) Transcript_68534:1045-1416(+)
MAACSTKKVSPRLPRRPYVASRLLDADVDAAVVQVVHDNYVAEVQVIDTRDVLRIDQAELQTVIPALHHKVMILNGRYRGVRAVLVRIDEAKYAVALRLDAGPERGVTVEGVPYEDFSKLHEK